jgi:hypothetical protein
MPEMLRAICSPEEFADNLRLDFSPIMKKKAGLDYIPWAEVVRALHQKIAYCTYAFEENGENGDIIFYTPNHNAYVRPYLTRYYPEDHLTVTSPSGFFPISNMAARHKAVEHPDIRMIDNCLRRAIAKEIGLQTGIGLSLWADSDPYDEVEDSPLSGSATPSTSRSKAVSVLAARGAATPPEEPSNGSDSPLDRLNRAATAAGLTGHGKQTVAVVARVGSWDDIPAERIPKILQALCDADKVKLYNAGRNSAGKEVNPRDPGEEKLELAAALKASAE